ncbi:MAG: hypothetical protein MZV70_52945 [Desulfobacterales bacterium]|nr:hypothetical protein [Desulfobacterales bacterium]
MSAMMKEKNTEDLKARALALAGLVGYQDGAIVSREVVSQAAGHGDGVRVRRRRTAQRAHGPVRRPGHRPRRRGRYRRSAARSTGSSRAR